MGACAHFDHLSTKRETNEGTAICLKNRRGGNETHFSEALEQRSMHKYYH
jgi:hypothetical protein